MLALSLYNNIERLRPIMEQEPMPIIEWLALNCPTTALHIARNSLKEELLIRIIPFDIEASFCYGAVFRIKNSYPDLFHQICVSQPRLALKYAKEIFQHTLGKCARISPEHALEYAAQYLDSDTIEWCATQAPCKALEFAAKYLKPHIIHKLAIREPRVAINFALQHLAPNTLVCCAVQVPYDAIEKASEKLPAGILEWCANQVPISALHYAGHLMRQEQFDDIINRFKDLFTDKDIEEYIKKRTGKTE
jgi:hypothetical protein